MQKDSIKREQSQAGLSFAERKNRRSLAGGESNFRPQVKRNKLLLLLALLMTAVTGAWAQTNLSQVMAAYTAQDGETLTGTLGENVKISIADGATVTLDGVTINGANDEDCGWAGITCLGDATIILEGANTVKGFYEDYPGINVPENKTLTIQGTGSLDASSNGYGAGIGGGYNINCGNIVISGGTITATGGYISAGIGGGGNATCGAITITSGVTKVTATKGTNAPYSIGSAANGSCGKVTIGGVEGAIDTSPYTYPTYTVTLKSGVKDADKWTVKVGEGQAQALPIGGLKGDGTETVTLQYNGRLKVKGVKATSEAAAEATPALSITSPSVGQVIGSDGKNYAYASLPTGVTAVAKICYVSGSNGLALALTDEDGTMAWSTAKTVCDAHTPAFTGGTWKLASEDEWNNMMSAAGSYSALCEGFSSVGGTNMIPYFYWSSTEFNSDLARDYDFGEGEWSADSKGEVDYVRACLAFTVEQAAKPAATVTTAPTGAAVVGVGKTTALVSGGVADGGTLWYAVTTANTKPTSTAGFSDAVPTAQSIKASGKVYVWYYVKGDDTHSDSEIAATAIEVPVADIVWDVTNVSNLYADGYGSSYEKEGVTLSSNGDVYAMWVDTGDPTTAGISFEPYDFGGFTFTAPTGKAFTKIEMKAVGDGGWATENLGTGWAFALDMSHTPTVTWTGSAASTVKLLPDTDDFTSSLVKSIVFYLSE